MCGKQREEINGFGIKEVDAIALAIKHAHDLVADHKWHCELGTSALGRFQVTLIFAYVGDIDRPLEAGGSAGDSLPHQDFYLVLAFVPSHLAADTQLLGVRIEQEDGDVVQVKIVARNPQDLIQHLIQVKGGQHRLARIVQDGNFLHVWADCTGRMSLGARY